MEIEERLQLAISSLSKKYSVPVLELRIKISRPEKKLVYEIMKNSEVVDEVTLATALNIGTIEAFVASGHLENIFNKLVKANALKSEIMNVRIYTKKADTCYPSLYLFDGTNPVKSLKEEDLK